MGILRRFREWREDKDGVLTGPDIDADSINTDEIDSKVINNSIVKADHPDFGSLQDALDFANSNNYYNIYIPEGTYSPVTPYDDQTLFGDGRLKTVIDGGSIASAIDCVSNSATRVTIEQLDARTDTGVGADLDAIVAEFSTVVRYCRIPSADRLGIISNDDRCVFVFNRFSSSSSDYGLREANINGNDSIAIGNFARNRLIEISDGGKRNQIDLNS
jgi:hypothetical protein